ncbi:hypothetical protein SuNHUV7_23400 (plasmid) [Pseudoseohaeicola sp. NH-UV-7]|uniref:DUF192 domain-containing protein n=1 Tax=Sulfitobacter sp. TBRI5 TaxID=2989732 RepID=UPI003A6CCFA5
MGSGAGQKRNVIRLFSVTAFLVMLCGTAFAACQQNAVTLRGDWGQARFTVEIADTAEERGRGLMFRENLPQSSGMLFVYDEPQTLSFWMKNTLIELDMIFLDKTGTVRSIHHRAQPGDLQPKSSGGNLLAVLEINGGLSKSLGISVGSEMRHPAFSDGPAAWPC